MRKNELWEKIDHAVNDWEEGDSLYVVLGTTMKEAARLGEEFAEEFADFVDYNGAVHFSFSDKEKVWKFYSSLKPSKVEYITIL